MVHLISSLYFRVPEDFCLFFSAGSYTVIVCVFCVQMRNGPWSFCSSTGPNLTRDSRARAGPNRALWRRMTSCSSHWTESLMSFRVSSSALCLVRIFVLCPYTWSVLIFTSDATPCWNKKPWLVFTCRQTFSSYL